MQCGDKCAMMTHVPRVLLSLVFVIGGFNFLMNFSSMTGYVGKGLESIWLPASLGAVALAVAIVLKLGGGLMLLANYKTNIAAWMLIAFTVLATLMYHMNWGGEGGQMQMTAFLKNLAIVGGLLLFAKCPCPKCKEGEACCRKDEGAPVSA